MQALEKEFVVVGGIKERMYSARIGYRKKQDNKIREMESQYNKEWGQAKFQWNDIAY